MSSDANATTSRLPQFPAVLFPVVTLKFDTPKKNNP